MNMVARMHGATIKRNVPGAVKNLRRKTNIKNAAPTNARKHITIKRKDQPQLRAGDKPGKMQSQGKSL
jgi:hypothetical protein